MLHTGADVSLRSKDGDSALYLATYGILSSPNPDVGILEDLIEAGRLEYLTVFSLWVSPHALSIQGVFLRLFLNIKCIKVLP